MPLDTNELISIICDRALRRLDYFLFESDSPEPEMLSDIFQDSSVQEKMRTTDSEFVLSKKAKSKKGVVNTTIEIKLVMKYQSKGSPKGTCSIFKRASFLD